MTRTADVVIVGGGITGVSIAFHLVGHGLRRVVVLERRFLGAGGTGRSVGILRQLYPLRECTEMVLRSLAVFRDFGARVGGHAPYVACGALIGVSPAMRPALERTLALQRALGVRAELYPPEEMARLEPRFATEGLGALLWEPDSGYGDPSAVTAGYAEAARRGGARIEQGVAVTGLLVEGGAIAGVRTSAGEEIHAPAVVDAAGLWAPEVAQMAGVALPIVIGRHPVFVVERDVGFGPSHPVYLDLAGGTYVRPETGGLTLTGSLVDDERQHPMDPELLGSETGFEEAAQALQRTSRAVPGLAEARLRQGYAGAFDITPDWMPILDETPVRGLYVAAGMSGHGFKLAPAMGEMMAARIVGAASPVSLEPFRLDRFARAGAEGSFVASYLPSA